MTPEEIKKGAPEGATHWHLSEYAYVLMFYKVDGGKWLKWNKWSNEWFELKTKSKVAKPL